MNLKRLLPTVEQEDEFESLADKKRRVTSLYIVHISMLVVSLGSSIIFTGLYPYLLMLDPSVTMLDYGIVVASDALAQMIFSPLFGILTDKIKSVRIVSILCCTLFCLGNCLYALTGRFDRDFLFGADLLKTRYYVMLVSRIIVGSGTAINSTGRYYISLATRLSERTTHIALLSLFQTVGFILGPGIQAGLTPLEGYKIGAKGELYFDMYTSTGWVSSTAGVICLCLYLPFVFNETYIAREELEYIKKKNAENKEKDKTAEKSIQRMSSRISLGPTKVQAKNEKARQLLKSYSRISVIDGAVNFSSNYNDEDEESCSSSSTTERKESSKQRRFPPWFPTLVCIYNFFSFLFNFVLIEAILTPLAMHMWAWSQADAIFYLGMTMIGGGLSSIVVFAFIGPLAKRFDERILLICAGIVPMLLGRAVMFPFPGVDYPTRSTVVVTFSCEYKNISNPGYLSEDHYLASPPFLSGLTPLLPYNTTQESYPAPVLGSLGLEASTTQTATTPALRSTTKPPCKKSLGCPYDWCDTIPKITIAQFLCGYIIATMGYPFCLTLCGSIYSKVLGNIPQGFWLGLLTTSGSLARVVGPIFVTDLYQDYGTYVTFSLVTATLGLGLILTLISFRQLVPTK